MSQLVIKDRIPERELLTSGHLACPGCGGALAMRLVLKAMGPETIVVLPACCWSIIAGPFPQSSLRVPLFHTAFETGAAVASGIRAALEVRGDTTTKVMAWAGDGGTFDIGLQALSGAAERGEDFLYVCYDNEAYMNTGIQHSSATPWGAWTTTTPADQAPSSPKKDILAIMAAHQIAYAATASVGYPLDLIRKAEKARDIHGTRFLHIMAPCPAGWKFPDELSVEVARLAVQSRMFPLVEVERGTTWRLTGESLEGAGQGADGDEAAGAALERYLAAQGRFRHFGPEHVEHFRVELKRRWLLLQKRVDTSS
jgi:pyruvate/2-oxoacid:ferredoxin oxidoreductase beta subunit